MNPKPEVNLNQARRKAGKVKRFHTEFTIQQQTLADHIFNIIRIYTSIWGELEKDVLKQIMYHDFEEFYLGDLPHWICYIPKLYRAYEDAETELRLELDIPTCDMVNPRIKVCDWIEACEFMLDEVEMGNYTLAAELLRLSDKLIKLLGQFDNMESAPVGIYLDSMDFLQRVRRVREACNGREVQVSQTSWGDIKD